MTELLGVLVGALLAHWFGRTQTRRAREERRVAIATALLQELRVVEYALHSNIRKEDICDWIGRINTELMDEARDYIGLFSADTIRSMQEFRGLVRAANSKWSFCQGIPCGQVEPLHHQQVRVYLIFAAERVKEVQEALLREGGLPPEEPPVQRVTFPNLPPIPEPVFNWELDLVGDKAKKRYGHLVKEEGAGPNAV